MKRYFVLLLALVMCVLLCACGKESEGENLPAEEEGSASVEKNEASSDENTPETNPAEENETEPEIEFEALPEEYFTYTIESRRATITGFDQNYQGLVVIPKTLGGYSVVSIGEGAFSGCLGITGVIIPKGVTSIGKSAFYGCKALTSATISASVTEIGESAFEWTGLTGVTIPSGVTSIGKKAFFWCFSLASVKLSDSVVEIGDSAFYFCNDLKDVYYASSEEDRAEIVFGMGNESFSGANWHYKEVE